MGLFPVADGEAIPASELGTFDVTVSNILAGTLVRLEPVLACLTKAGEEVNLFFVLTCLCNNVSTFSLHIKSGKTLHLTFGTYFCSIYFFSCHVRH